MPFRSSALSHPGMRRDANEDSYCARPDLGLFVVADGLGGHPGGQLASRLVVEAFEATIAGTLDPADCARYGISPSPDREQRTRDAFHVACQRLALVAGEAARAAMAWRPPSRPSCSMTPGRVPAGATPLSRTSATAACIAFTAAGWNASRAIIPGWKTRYGRGC